jgi:hypothetical protein
MLVLQQVDEKYWCCVNIPPRPLDGNRKRNSGRPIRLKTGDFFEKALVTQCQRQESDREVDSDPAEGECYVGGVGNRNRGETF